MWHYTLINSEDERPAKQILQKPNNTWYKELQQYATTYNINIQQHWIQTISYKDHKENVKSKIKRKIIMDITEKKKTMTKLRWVTPGKEQHYFKSGHCTKEETKTIIRIRLHMISTKCNRKRDEDDTTCRRCGKEEETTNHVLDCYTKMRFDEEKLEETTWLKSIVPFYEEIDELHRDKPDGRETDEYDNDKEEE